MQAKLIITLGAILILLVALVYTAILGTAKTVVTIAELTSTSTPRKGVRVGARVAAQEIIYRTDPDFLLEFSVTDPGGTKSVLARYQGIMPNTLKNGRDVILEGDYDGQLLLVKTLLTQCPSKYEPPVPHEYKERNVETSGGKMYLPEASIN